MNYIASSAANGSIGYVEYSYPAERRLPGGQGLNSGGYYTFPRSTTSPSPWSRPRSTWTRARRTTSCRPDQRLHRHRSADLPVSSYVYMIEPTGGPGARDERSDETSGKRQSIADFEYYSICQGQSQIGPIGYSPLPVNLVEAAFGQIQKLQQADPASDLTNLNIRPATSRPSSRVSPT